MFIHDISLPITNSMVVWPGDSPVSLKHSSHIEWGDIATVTRLDLGAHTGTHVDAPVHFVAGGMGVDKLPLDVLVGPAVVVQALEVDALSADVLASLPIPPGSDRVLFRTRNSQRWAQGETEFDTDFVAVTEDGAQWLIDNSIRLVGIDSLSVAPYDDGVPTHRALLRAGIAIVEGLDLSRIESGVYQLVCLPLRIKDCDGAPARAILIEGPNT